MKKILIVEDDPMKGMGMEAFLKNLLGGSSVSKSKRIVKINRSKARMTKVERYAEYQARSAAGRRRSE